MLSSVVDPSSSDTMVDELLENVSLPEAVVLTTFTSEVDIVGTS